MPKSRIGLLGGSFNPAHDGHRDISLCALQRLRLDEVWWLVSPQNPLKPVAGMAPLANRLMQAKKIARCPKIKVTDIETRLGTLYTVDTLRQLRRRYKGVQFVWLMGADNLKQIPRWKKWPVLFHTVPVAVFRRPDYVAGRGVGKAAQRFSRSWHPASRAGVLAGLKAPAWVLVNNRLNKISATSIRNGNKN